MIHPGKMHKYSLKNLIHCLWPAYFSGENEHNYSLIMRFWFIQKILRINSKVPWPVHPTSKVIAPERIKRGSRTPGLSGGCHIDGRNGIIFGNNVWIGPHVKIISMNHHICSYNKYIRDNPIRIGNNCWIGAGAIILPGVQLGDHTIVGAGSVVTKSFLDCDQILAGNPALVIKNIEPYEAKNLVHE